MADFEELSFVIPGYTPETMPLGRLIEYLQQMAVVLGDPTNLHLVEIRHSSVAPVLHAPKAIALEARERASRVPRGDGTKRQVDAYNRIRRMVRRDASGTEYSGRPALLKTAERVILEIPAAADKSGTRGWLEAGNYHRRAIDQNWGGRGRRGIASAGSRRPHFVRVYRQATPSERTCPVAMGAGPARWHWGLV